MKKWNFTLKVTLKEVEDPIPIFKTLRQKYFVPQLLQAFYDHWQREGEKPFMLSLMCWENCKLT